MDTDPIELPSIDPQLVAFLNEKFSGRLPSESVADLNKVNFALGQRSVVDFLQGALRAEQQRREPNIEE